MGGGIGLIGSCFVNIVTNYTERTELTELL